jgi:hypothetical protein
MAAQPDWILVTSWNEFWENTHIEPSVFYGRRYQSRTRTWSELFRLLDGPGPPVRSRALRQSVAVGEASFHEP